MTAGDPRFVDLRARVRDERALLAELYACVSVEHREQIERLTKEHGPDAKVR